MTMLPYDALAWLAPQIRRLDRKTTAASVLTALVKFADQRNGVAFPTQRQIVSMCWGIAEHDVNEWQIETVRKATKVLIGEGLIEVLEKSQKGRAMRYRVLWNKASGSPSATEGETPENEAPSEAATRPLRRTPNPPPKEPLPPSDAAHPNSQSRPANPDLPLPDFHAEEAEPRVRDRACDQGAGEPTLLDFDLVLDRDGPGTAKGSTQTPGGRPANFRRGADAHTRVNKFWDRCKECSHYVPANRGRLNGVRGAWEVRHSPGQCMQEMPEGLEAIEAAWDTWVTVRDYKEEQQYANGGLEREVRHWCEVLEQALRMAKHGVHGPSATTAHSRHVPESGRGDQEAGNDPLARLRALLAETRTIG